MCVYTTINCSAWVLAVNPTCCFSTSWLSHSSVLAAVLLLSYISHIMSCSYFPDPASLLQLLQQHWWKSGYIFFSLSPQQEHF